MGYQPSVAFEVSIRTSKGTAAYWRNLSVSLSREGCGPVIQAPSPTESSADVCSLDDSLRRSNTLKQDTQTVKPTNVGYPPRLLAAVVVPGLLLDPCLKKRVCDRNSYHVDLLIGASVASFSCSMLALSPACTPNLRTCRDFCLLTAVSTKISSFPQNRKQGRN